MGKLSTSAELVCPLCRARFPADSGDRCPVDGALLYPAGAEAQRQGVALEPGARVAGRYLIIDELRHRPGAGRTFRARQENLEREVELRVLPRDALATPTDHARFRRRPKPPAGYSAPRADWVAGSLRVWPH